LPLLFVCSQSQLAVSMLRHGAVYFRATCICLDTYVKYLSDRKCQQKFRSKFHDGRVPRRQKIHNFVHRIRSTQLLTHKKQNQKASSAYLGKVR
jgi:hypothetical protein